MSKTGDDLSAALSRAAGGTHVADESDRRGAKQDGAPAPRRYRRGEAAQASAVERDTTVQHLGEEAVDRLFKRYRG